MTFDEWWRDNKPEEIPVDCYHLVKESCRAAWDRSMMEENFRCGLIAELYLFDREAGKNIANNIYREEND